MHSPIAGALAQELRESLRNLSPQERLALAFRLGDDDLELYRHPRGLERDAARRLIRRERQRGRRRSACAE